jgi:hypothetical protein
LKLIEKRTKRHKDRETERQRDRETERQRDRETERQRDRETERQRDHFFPIFNKTNLMLFYCSQEAEKLRR